MIYPKKSFLVDTIINYFFRSFLVVRHELKVQVVLQLSHRHPDDLLRLLWQLGEDFGLETSEEKRPHDPLGVGDAILLVLGAPVFFLTFLSWGKNRMIQDNRLKK